RKAERTVTVKYEIEPLLNGSRLRLFNKPSDEVFELHISSVMTTTVGTGSQEEWAQFSGLEYRYSNRFYDARAACIRESVPKPRQIMPDKIVLDPILWTRIPEPLVPNVEQQLDLLAHLHSQGQSLAYREALSDLARLIGTPSLTPKILSKKGSVDLKH